MNMDALAQLNWTDIERQLDVDGYALLPGLLSVDKARSLAQTIMQPEVHHVSLESCDLGRGELCHFDNGMPPPLEAWRGTLYHRLLNVAHRWNDILRIDQRYPATLDAFLAHNRQAGQTRAQSHISRLASGDHLVLHQRNVGQHVFPLQLIALLSAPQTDFEGGEFVMTEQRPRMQSRPMVLPLNLGDAAIIATAQRPIKGTKGYYPGNLRHAISRVRKGVRIGVELTLHDAA